MKSKIPWNRLIIEATVIVGSILLAFAIDAWWDRVQEEQYRRELLVRLDTAFAENIRLIDTRLERFPNDSELFRSFFNMDPNRIQDSSTETAKEILENILAPRTNPLNNDIILTILSTGNSLILREALLQDTLSNWRTIVNVLERRRELLAEQERIGIVAMAKHEEIKPYIESFAAGSLPNLQDGSGTKALIAARSDPDITSLATGNEFWRRLYARDLGRLRSQSESARTLIQSILR